METVHLTYFTGKYDCLEYSEHMGQLWSREGVYAAVVIEELTFIYFFVTTGINCD